MQRSARIRMLVLVLSGVLAVIGSTAQAIDEQKYLEVNKIIRGLQIGELAQFPGTSQMVKSSARSLTDKLNSDATVVQPRLPSAAQSGVGLGPKFSMGTLSPFFDMVVRIKFKRAHGAEPDTCSGLMLYDELDESEVSGVKDKEIVQVLTAAHCSCGEPGSYGFYLSSPEPKDDPNFVLASLPVRYADYSCRLDPEMQPGRDLALLSIRPKGDLRSKPLRLSTPLIATMQQVYADTATKRLVGVGYGRIETTRKTTTQTFAAAIPIASHFCVAGSFAASQCASFREFVLADTTPARGATPADSCGGDSGAPIFWVPPLSTKTGQELADIRFLVGVTSRGLAGVRNIPGLSCGGGGLYTAVGHPDVLAWLTANSAYVRTRFKIDAE